MEHLASQAGEKAVNGSETREPALRELKAGDQFTSFFVIRKKEMKTKKDGTPYLLFELGDHTGRMGATLWDGVRAVHDAVRVGDAIKVRGAVVEYNDGLQIIIEKMRKTESSDGVDARRFLRREGIDLSAQFLRLTGSVESVRRPELRSLLKGLLEDPDIVERFREAPGGKLWHHAYLGGLVQHTLAVKDLCVRAAEQYESVDGELLAAGALLHDLGKIDEYEWHRGFIEYTDRGRLWGHVVLGARRIDHVIERLEAEEPFPEEIRKRLLHMVVAHHGRLEQGAPVVPMTPEAFILHHADEMDSKVNAIGHIVEKEKTGESRWSRYVQLLDRFVYLGE